MYAEIEKLIKEIENDPAIKKAFYNGKAKSLKNTLKNTKRFMANAREDVAVSGHTSDTHEGCAGVLKSLQNSLAKFAVTGK